jgi:hypothetical protein
MKVLQVSISMGLDSSIPVSPQPIEGWSQFFGGDSRVLLLVGQSLFQLHQQSQMGVFLACV